MPNFEEFKGDRKLDQAKREGAIPSLGTNYASVTEWPCDGLQIRITPVRFRPDAPYLILSE